jgi:hypothetical protein
LGQATGNNSHSTSFTGTAPGVGAQGSPGGDGGAASAPLIPVTNKYSNNLDFINIVTSSGGAGGQGGSGGDAGASGGSGGNGEAGGLGALAYTGTSATPPGQGAAGGAGGPGGKGAAGASANKSLVYIYPASGQLITVSGPTRLVGGSGGPGGSGGTSGQDLNGVLGGAGGDGGAGGAASQSEIYFKSASGSPVTVVFENQVTIISGSGGPGGAGGLLRSTSSQAVGQGGAGGQASDLLVDFEGDLLLKGLDFRVISGDGGLAGAQNQASKASPAGAGGQIAISVQGHLKILDNSNLYLTKGLNQDSLAGQISFEVKKVLEIYEDKKFTLVISNNLDDLVDKVTFNTLLFNPGSELVTTAYVYTNNNSGLTSFYGLNNLDVINKASWSTKGVYAPVTINNDFVRFDTKDIGPNGLMLSFQGSEGVFELSDFDPMAQQEKYLLVRPSWADQPNYRVDSFPAFLLSPYQTKRLNLGLVTLVDQTSGQNPAAMYLGADGKEYFVSRPSAQGPLYDDFAFTAGLRRYYWQVYVDNNQVGRPLLAHNYFTAEATRVFAQSLGAVLLALGQSQNLSLMAFEKIDSFGPSDRVYLNAFVGGARLRSQSGSYVEVDSLNAALFLSKKSQYDFGQLSLALFGEFGQGNYDTYSNIARYGEVFGNGELTYYGGGFVLKIKFKEKVFIETSLRGGGFRNEYSLNKDPWIQFPEVHAYESQNSYYGAQLGLGRDFDLKEKTSLRVYARYFWTRTGSDQFKTSFGDLVKMEASDSSRARLGARFSRLIARDTVRFYFGAAAEQEFDGKIMGRYAQEPISCPPESQGFSGFGELGLNIWPTDSRKFSLNAEIFGYLGTQKGLGGSASMGFNF